MINPNIIHDHHDLDALIRAAHTRPTEDLIQRIIDRGLDYRGNYVGQVHAAYIWRKAVTSH